MTVRALFISAALSLFTVSACEAGQGDRVYDLGTGVGMNMNSQNANQGFLYAGVGWDSEKYDFLGFRIEGGVDLIGNDKPVIIATVMPVFRFYVQTGSDWRPFFDLGAGVSLKHGDLVGGRHMDGPVAFDIMDGIGVEYRPDGGRRLTISTKFKHISNSGLYERNQGFNAQYIVFSAGF